MTKTLTPTQQQGFEIGKLYRVTNNEYNRYLDQGDIVKFTRDDESDCPWFKKTVKAGSYLETMPGEVAIDLSDLEPYEQPTTTKQKLSPQELLLMYVKQHYPEDRVMIAMVENI